MRNALEVTAWVKVREDCDISYTINGDNDVELLFGGRYDGFELIIPAEATVRLAEVAKLAVAEADTLPDEDDDLAANLSWLHNRRHPNTARTPEDEPCVAE